LIKLPLKQRQNRWISSYCYWLRETNFN